ncbi:MAG: hypothetical protein LKM38_06500 [Pseudomonas veronii]|jgi:hypothetical protein|nr:hypothetical protein [Pseudomonas veronii]
MRISNSQLFPQTMPEPATYPPSQPPVNQAREPAREHGLPWTERALASDAAAARSRRNTRSMPVASATTTSTLNKVSDPKLEIKKVATSPNGLYGLSYSLSAPGAGLSNITFPMSIDEGLQRKGSKDAGIYYAMQFGVNDAQGRPLGRGYIGMQPRGDGKALIVFFWKR